MMDCVQPIFDDPREIEAIWHDGENAPGYWTKSKNALYMCTKIIAYREYGQGDFMPFFAVYRGDRLHARVPAWMVTVQYAERIEG